MYMRNRKGILLDRYDLISFFSVANVFSPWNIYGIGNGAAASGWKKIVRCMDVCMSFFQAFIPSFTLEEILVITLVLR